MLPRAVELGRGVLQDGFLSAGPGGSADGKVRRRATAVAGRFPEERRTSLRLRPGDRSRIGARNRGACRLRASDRTSRGQEIALPVRQPRVSAQGVSGGDRRRRSPPRTGRTVSRRVSGADGSPQHPQQRGHEHQHRHPGDEDACRHERQRSDEAHGEIPCSGGPPRRRSRTVPRSGSGDTACDADQSLRRPAPSPGWSRAQPLERVQKLGYSPAQHSLERVQFLSARP